MSQSKTKLLELINSSNFPPVPLTDENVDLIGVAASEGGTQWNTSVQVVAKPGQGYTGARTLFYRRLELPVLGALSFSSLALQGDTQALLDAINTRTGAALEAVDLLPVEVPLVAGGQSASCVLTAAPGSLRWIGEHTVTVAGEQVDCDPPAPIPVLSVDFWWAALNTYCLSNDPNPYGGVFAQHNYDAITKLDETGAVQWAKHFVSATYDAYQPQALKMTRCQQNELCVVTAAKADGTDTVLGLVALDTASGAALWSKVLHAPAEIPSWGALDTNGGCIFLGANVINGPANSERSAAVLKIRQDGSIGWQYQFQSQVTAPYTTTEYVLTDNQENVYALVVENTTGDTSLVKFDKTGTLLWQQTYQGIATGYSLLALHSSQDVILTGMSSSSQYSVAARIAAADGTVVWTTIFTPVNAAANVAMTYAAAATGLACDGQGGIYLQTNIALVALDADGSLVWSKQADMDGAIDRQNAGQGGETGTLHVRQGVLYTGWTATGDGSNVGTAVLALPVDGSAGDGAYSLSNGSVMHVAANTVLQVDTGNIAMAPARNPSPLLVSVAALTLVSGDILTEDDVLATWSAAQPLPLPLPALAVADAVVETYVAPAPLPTPAPTPAPAPAGTFVMVGGGDATSSVRTSADGVNWTLRANDGGFWSGVVAGPDKFLFFQDNPPHQIASSADGISGYTLATRPALKAQGLRRAAYSASLGVWVAPGFYTDDSSNDLIARSTDGGLTWTAVALAPASGNPFLGNVIRSERLGLFLACGNGVVCTSPDGLVWTTAAVGPGGALRGIEDNGTTLVLAGNAGQIYESADGVNWTQVSAPDYSNGKDIYGVLWFAPANLWIFYGDGVVQTSADLVTFTPVVLPADVANALWVRMVSTGTQLLAVAGNVNDQGKLITSTDGASFTEVASTGGVAGLGTTDLAWL